jgi:hypothetical protein
MADGGRAHTKFCGGQRKAAAPGNRNDDRQMDKEIAVHSCMISHGLCEQCNLINASAGVHIVANAPAPTHWQLAIGWLHQGEET